ncbi:FtsK/SpoIIIE domain-containing protein, partial [Chloroflexus sp.]|uniref:FtsK/SpoIIIE domain-containing protein n=1 Tax=Chloroflexus sp. TaxID=1904827 RepID=UPI00404B2FD7
MYWLLLQIAVHHSPADVRLAVFWFKERDRQWDWLRWLPHTRPFDDDSYRLLARYDADHAHFQQVVTVLKDEMQQRRENGIEGCPHIVVVLDGYDRAAGRFSDLDHIVEVGATLGISFLCLVPEFRQTPALGHGYIRIDDRSESELAMAGPQGYTKSIRTDRVTREEIERVARKLAGLGVQLETRYVLPRVVRFSTLLGLGDLQYYKPLDYWQEIEDPYQSWYPVPVGMISDDQALEINLNEGVHGVHGIIAGTTGSGKSEFLLTFLMSLAVRHSPQRLQFLLIDFKGGATFKDLEPLPHTVGMVTDLSGNEATRALIAINSELDRRKRTLKERNVTNIREYRREAQRSGWPPIANLMIAIDEFDEMVRDYPEFVDELIRVAKQGRSLGVYLLLATQQPSQVKEGLLRNITYRVALRVTAPEDSKAMVGIPDAAYLTTATPGRGYFGVNKQVSIFQSARITLPYQPIGDNRSGSTYIDVTGKYLPSELLDTTVEKVVEAMQDDRLKEAQEIINAYYSQIAGRSLSEEEQHIVQTELQQIQQSPQPQHDNAVRKLINNRLLLFRETELQLITAAMKKEGEKQVSIWNPPLPTYLALGDHRLQLKQSGHLQTVIGLSDDPVTVKQEPVIYHLLSPQNNLIAIGSAQSGKTTLLRTLMIGLAYTSTPDELCMYVIDAVGKACGLLPDDKDTKREDDNKKLPRIPHIADAIAGEDLEKIDRLLFELDDAILKRRDWCRRHNTENLAAYIRKREHDATLPPPPPYILVVIDNIVELGEKFDAFLQRLQQGRPYGIAFAVTVGMEKDIKQKRQLFDIQVVLRVNDPNESEVLLNKKLAAFISEKNPGRAFLRQSKKPMELQIALPILTDITTSADGENDVYLNVEDELGKTVDEIVHRHFTPQVPDRRLRLLDKSIALNQLLAETPSLRVPFARNGRDLQPIAFDFRTVPPDLLIAGGSGSGKSVALRTLLTSFTKQYSPQEVQFVLIDYTRRTLEPFARSEFAREWQVIVPEALPQAHNPLSNRSQWRGVQKAVRMATEATEMGALCLALYDELVRRKKIGENTPRLLLIIEDLDLVQQEEWVYLNILAPFVMRGSDVGFHVIVTATTYTNCISQHLMKVMVQKQQMIVLGKPNDLNQEVISGFKWPKEFANVSFPPGRGVIRLPNVPYSVVQVANITEEEMEDALRPYQIA